ncbi:MAG: glycoside hydrolase family 3 protein [Desulfobulbaceae bacterium]|nr:glycoside hydrolase family 3 protein [Desulfobulbaceae bacterium]
MKKPSLEQQIGQLFIIGFQGQSVSSNHSITEDIKLRHLGGVILFDRHLASKSSLNNIVSPEQLRKLTNRLQQASDTPLLIAVDQEGGRVNRFRKDLGFHETPPAKELGDTGDLQLTRQSAVQTSQLLKDVGINFNFAPVVDLNINSKNPIIGKYGRSFSKDSSAVVEHSKIWIEEHRKAGIISCLKHFPGHGSSIADSHLGFVDISATWQESELQPFARLIEGGFADTIMAGHLFNQLLDRRNPATLSSEILQRLLRQQLQFKGVTVSDDMQMKAITSRYGFEEACCRAIAAGIDLVVIGNNICYDPDLFNTVRKALLKGLEASLITEERIYEAWSRVNDLKSKF